MEIPQYGNASITSPKQYIDYILTQKKIDLPAIPEYCFIIYSKHLLETILAKYPWKMVDIGSRNPTEIYFCAPETDHAFAIIGEQLGASMSAVVLEELIALGFSKFFSTGTTGHPCMTGSQNLAIGDFIIVENALIYEGTSNHYRPCTELAYADAELCGLASDILSKQGAVFHCGRIATTDALYRETAQFIENIIKRGALAVDMETSALYTVAEFHGKQICAILYVSDIIRIDNDWNTDIMSQKIDHSESMFLELIDRIVRSKIEK